MSDNMRRLVRVNLSEVIRSVIVDVQRLPTSDVVDIGVLLYQAGHTLRQAMDRVKDVLREHARMPHTTRFEGMDGFAIVSAPEVILRMSKDADVNALRQVLGENFAQFFVLQVVPRPEAMARILEYPPAVQAVVFANIEQDFGSGGVMFTPKKTV